MKTLYTLIMLIQIASDKPVTIEPDPICANVPYVVYNVENQVICVPSDEIFLNSFENND